MDVDGYVHVMITAIDSWSPIPLISKKAAAFQESKDALKREVMLDLLKGLEQNPQISQRALAQELGIAMGLVNSYIKRAMTKGWLKAKQIPARRYAYYLTPQGLTEKGQLAAEYLTSSFTFFRSARGQCLDLFTECEVQGWNKVALVGTGELAQIAELIATQCSVDAQLVDPEVVSSKDFDVVMLVDIQNPQSVFEKLLATWPENRILTPALLYISRGRQQEKQLEK